MIYQHYWKMAFKEKMQLFHMCLSIMPPIMPFKDIINKV